MKKVMLSWSSGKDSAWTLHQLRQQRDVEVVGLLTTFNAEFDRVAMHGVRHTLVTEQANAANLPLLSVPLPWPCSNADYEAIMGEAVVSIRTEYMATHVAFGDLFLEDIRAYREKQMRDTGLELLFPLWKKPTRQLAETMIASGLQAVITCVDPKQMNRKFCGRKFDSDLLGELPGEVDPCGEHGEFHSFVFGGPMFSHEISIITGDTIERDDLVYTDVLAAGRNAA